MGRRNDINMDEALRKVFGPEAFAEEEDTRDANDARLVEILERVNSFITTELGEETSVTSSIADSRPGRIGPPLARFDVSTHHGLFIVSPDRLSVNSQSNFSTMRGNVGLFRGRWMYEVQLGSKGVMQVGWGTAQCQFSQESGVGDTINSFAYDGNRVRKWNVRTHKYGEPWLSGDIIGCALDLDDGFIEFYRNGRSMGRAFEGVCTGEGMAYFPTVSLAFTENLTANFGSTPLRYPVAGYETLQAAPKSQVDKATLLFEWFQNVILLMEKNNESKSNTNNIATNTSKTISRTAFIGCLARCIFQHLGPFLSIPYIIEATFIPFLVDLCGLNLGATGGASRLGICLNFLWTFLEEHEIKACLESIVVYLLSAFRHVSLLLDYPDQCRSLTLLTNLCRHTETRQHLLQFILFDRVRFANFVHVKPLDESGLAEVVKVAWWETSPIDAAIEVNKKSYLRACERIKSAISEVEALQVELLVTLLDNSDGTPSRPASRTIFLKKFRRFVQENVISSRTPLPITLCCFHRLLVAFRVLCNLEIGTSPIYIPCRAFYDGSINYAGIDRLGGVLSHLNKTYKTELIHLLGPEHEVITVMDQTSDESNSLAGGSSRFGDLPIVIPTFARMISMNSNGPAASPMILERLGFFPNNREDRTPIKYGPADGVLSLLEFLDGIILFYHVAAKKQIAKVASLRESMSEYVNAMADIKARLENAKKHKDPDSVATQQELERTASVFEGKLVEQSRHMAWVRAAVYSREKQAQLAWLLGVVTLTLRAASNEGTVFSFVPDFYLEAMTDLCIGIRNHVHPTAPIQGIPNYERMLIDAAKFLCDHFLDPRIVHANSKDTLILTLAGFVSNPLTLSPLEKVPIESRIKIVNSLLRPYENRAWAQSNWVLVRFWQGNGFAFRYEKSPHLEKKIGPKILQQESVSQAIKPCPSLAYQGHVRDALLANTTSTTLFLNSLLNQLNWAFSEFIGMLQEIQNVSSRPERVLIESRQLKICATCFDLAISLLRVLEMIATIATPIFTDPSQSSSENLLARLCQLLCQILNRVSSQTGCFQHVVLLDIPDLETVDHFPILAAVVGILLALLKDDIATFSAEAKLMPRATKALLMEPSFQINSLHFVLGDLHPKNQKIKNVKLFSLQNYKDDVTEEEIKRVKDMIRYLDANRAMLADTKLITDEENICTICYAYPISATFKPCDHGSCRACIAHHLLNSRECFFCKAIIDRVVDLDGGLLHDFLSDHALQDDASTL